MNAFSRLLKRSFGSLASHTVFAGTKIFLNFVDNNANDFYIFFYITELRQNCIKTVIVFYRFQGTKGRA